MLSTTKELSIACIAVAIGISIIWIVLLFMCIATIKPSYDYDGCLYITDKEHNTITAYNTHVQVTPEGLQYTYDNNSVVIYAK